jgi:NitT/TauT family transport system permease protein
MTVSGGREVDRGRASALKAPPLALASRLRGARRALRSPHPYLMVLGIVAAVLAYWLATEVLRLPRFAKIPGPVRVVTEWLNPDPVFGVSVYSAEYYQHILYSVERVGLSFALATALGVPLGLMTGWSQKVRDYAFPIIELLRPIPILAWVPLAVIMFSGRETPVIFLAFLASFFVTVLNTHLGVKSIDEAYFRAAACLGSSPAQIFRHVVVPGALPYIFTGLQISMGVNWFSLVAAEMVSGNFGLGYLILNSYVSMTYVTIIIGMATLGIVGALSSGLIRWLGNRLMQWRLRSIGMGGAR